MANAKLLMPHILKFEGGFVNDPADRGGATNKGVTIGTFRQFYGQNKTVQDLKNITDEQWLHIFKTGFWDKMHGDEIENQSVANFLVDWAYNAGPKVPTQRLQKILAVKADGIIGPITMGALNGADQKKLFGDLKVSRIAFYQGIVERSPSQAKFLRGWLRRTGSLKFEP